MKDLISSFNYCCFTFDAFIQTDDEANWAIMKPEIFAVIMDFFASGLPVLTEEKPAGDTGQ